MRTWTRVALYLGLTGVVLVATAVSASARGGAAQGPVTKVEPAVVGDLVADGEATFWVFLKAKAKLGRAAAIPGWAARGKFVVDELHKTADQSQSGLRSLLKKRDAKYETFWIANAIKVTGGADLIKEIAAQPEVDEILGDRVYRIEKPSAADTAAVVQAVEWNITKINAPQVWSTFGDRGEGMVVANIDTGVQYNHPALVGKYRGNIGGGNFDHNYNWYDPSLVCGNPSLAPCDNNNHGTHTMRTMVGDDGAGNQIGVAPGAKWIAAKGCESSSCSSAALLNSGQWILAPTKLDGTVPRADLRPNVVNNSWGGGGADPWYQATVDAWIASGIFPAFSNGNSGPGCNTSGSPGDYTQSYSAGAFDSGNAIASFSSRGASGFGAEIKPNIAAPGVNIRSSIAGNAYSAFNGTSMASPHVAGTVALIWSAAPTLVGNIAATRVVLDSTAQDTSDLTCGGTAADNNVWGEGKLDAFAAVNAAPRGPTGTLQGTVTATGGGAVEGAKIEITGPTARTTFTDAGGNYSVLLSTGTYSMTVSSFGKVSQTANNVAVTQNATTTRDFVLSTAPSFGVSGFVRDGNGVGIANATVTILDTPLAPVTTNGSGFYSFASVPSGSYQAKAEAGRCASPQTKALTVSGGAATLDFALTALSDGFYSCSLQASSYIPGTTTLALTGDDVSLAVALPWSFTLYGTPYSTVNVSTNGHVSFTGPSTVFSNEGIPTVNAPNAAIYPFWDDLFVDASASVRTATLTSPNRFVIDWNNVYFFGDTSRRVNVELVLYQDGRILAQYGAIAADGREQGNSATIGLENAAGSVALQYSFNEAVVGDSQAIVFTPAGAAPPTITTATLPDGTTTVAYSQQATATGGTTPYTWTLDAGTLPPGLTLTSGTPSATLSGTPTTIGTYGFTLRVTAAGGQFDTQAYTVDVRAPLVVTPASLPGGTVGTPYAGATLTATGGTATKTWALDAGSGPLPPGLSLATNGTISGTPTASGTYPFTARATDAGSPARTDTEAFSITVAPGSSLAIVTTSPLAPCTQNVSCSRPLGATGGTGNLTWSVIGGALPPGMALDASTGVISGAPSKVANFSFTIRVTDSSSPPKTASKAFTLKVNKK